MEKVIRESLKDIFIKIFSIIIFVIHSIGITLSCFYAVILALFWDDPSLDMSKDYLPMVWKMMYPILLGFLFLVIALYVSGTYEKKTDDSISKKRKKRGVFLLFALIIPLILVCLSFV